MPVVDSGKSLSFKDLESEGDGTRIRVGRLGDFPSRLIALRFGPDSLHIRCKLRRSTLGRRLSAQRRNGCCNRLKELSTASGFDAESWLHGDVVARYFAG
jgi:hypothetical protein